MIYWCNSARELPLRALYCISVAQNELLKVVFEISKGGKDLSLYPNKCHTAKMRGCVLLSPLLNDSDSQLLDMHIH